MTEMRRRQVFAHGVAVGVMIGALAYPAGRVLGQALFNHSVMR